MSFQLPQYLPVLCRGCKGQKVTEVQKMLLITQDGIFGEDTEKAVRSFQEANGLAVDGVVGTGTWAALLGESIEEVEPWSRAKGPAPACSAALRGATKAWPNRKRDSDGIMGDAAHQARPSDHNLGNAVDITHDPSSGCDGAVIAKMAIQDSRVTYVIWNRQICSRSRMEEGWRPYTGANPHTHHVHISIKAERRHDASPWPWEPKEER